MLLTKSDLLEQRVYGTAKLNRYWWVLPQMTYNSWIADFICYGNDKKHILEIEIKRSWGDYRADYQKCTTIQIMEDYARVKKFCKDRKIRVPKLETGEVEVSKYSWLCRDYPAEWRPTAFIYAAPIRLAERIAEDKSRPISFGVWAFEDDSDSPGKVLVPMTKLQRLRPWYLGVFRDKACKKSIRMLENSFGYDGWLKKYSK